MCCKSIFQKKESVSETDPAHSGDQYAGNNRDSARGSFCRCGWCLSRIQVCRLSDIISRCNRQCCLPRHIAVAADEYAVASWGKSGDRQRGVTAELIVQRDSCPDGVESSVTDAVDAGPAGVGVAVAIGMSRTFVR